MDLSYFLTFVVFVLLAAAAGFIAQRALITRRLGDAEELAKGIVDKARKEAQAQKKEMLLQGQDELFNQKKEMENEFREREREVKNRERKLDELNERLEEKQEKATEKERDLLKLEKELAHKERELTASEAFLASRIEEEEVRLSEIAGLSPEEARAKLMSEIEVKRGMNRPR